MADLLTAEQIAGMRAFATAQLPDQAFIWRQDMVEDEMGSQKPRDPNSEMPGYKRVNAIDEPIPARLDTLGTRESELAARYSSQLSWALVLPALTDIQPADRVQVAGHTLEVQPVGAPPSWEIQRRVIASEVGSEGTEVVP